MQKTTAFLLVFSMLFLCACSKKEKPPVTFPSEQTTEEVTSLTGTPEIRELSTDVGSSTVIDTENLAEIYPIDFTQTVIKGEKNENRLTGHSALSSVSYSLPSERKDITLSDEKLSHSHGPASGGKAHHTVVEFQKTFDSFGAFTLAPKESGKVLYLTFDCGYEYENLTADILDTLKQKQVPAAFFCTLDHIKKEKEIISRMIREGHIVGNHSATHPSFATISREKMMKEIEETENYLREHYGYVSKFFRFPAGEYTTRALDLVASLGYVSVFWSVAYNDWNTEKVQGKDYAAQTVVSRLHDGAIILLHSVSRDNAAALGEIIDRARQQGYSFRALDEIR